MTADPFLAIRVKNRSVECVSAAGVTHADDDPFEVLRVTLSRYRSDTIPDLPPFQGGAAGYLAYDLNAQLEAVPLSPLDDLRLPDLCVGIYDWVIAWDHESGDAWLVSTGHPEVGPARARRGAARADAVEERLSNNVGDWTSAGNLHPALHGDERGFAIHAVPGASDVFSTFSRADYLRAVARTRDYILAGDIFQANISQRLERSFERHPFSLYRALARLNPAPFASYFQAGPATVVSASPERFLRLVDGQVETRPIKGTCARGRTSEEDARLARALLDSVKDRAENVMIVDVLRNDLSKVCDDHTVLTPELCAMETYETVRHLVSTVVGRLRPGLEAVDLMQATFPGGSITGAPKIRAMEIIAELEPTRRGVYTGAIGYIGFDGTMDTSIAIRTFVVSAGKATFQVGGGIVADSDPELEYLETLAKAGGLLSALGACT